MYIYKYKCIRSHFGSRLRDLRGALGISGHFMLKNVLCFFSVLPYYLLLGLAHGVGTVEVSTCSSHRSLWQGGCNARSTEVVICC